MSNVLRVWQIELAVHKGLIRSEAKADLLLTTIPEWDGLGWPRPESHGQRRVTLKAHKVTQAANPPKRGESEATSYLPHTRLECK